MYKRRRYANSGRKSGEDNIFDNVERLGNLAIMAHEKGGMPLVFSVIGVFSLILTAGFIFFNSSIFLISTFVILTIGFFAIAIYLYNNKKRELCPKCGKELIIKKGKYGEFYACPGYPDCQFAKNKN